MKRRLIIPLAAAVLAGAVTFCMIRTGADECVCGGRTLERENISFLADELDLTPEQESEIKDMFVGLEARIEESCGRHCAARMRLGSLAAADQPALEQEDLAIAELVKAYEESERAALENMRKVRALLEPGQKAKFDQLISKCICKSCAGCGMGDGAAGAGK